MGLLRNLWEMKEVSFRSAGTLCITHIMAINLGLYLKLLITYMANDIKILFPPIP